MDFSRNITMNKRTCILNGIEGFILLDNFIVPVTDFKTFFVDYNAFSHLPSCFIYFKKVRIEPK